MAKIKARDGYDSFFGDYTDYTDGKSSIRYYKNGSVVPRSAELKKAIPLTEKKLRNLSYNQDGDIEEIFWEMTVD